MIKYNYEVSVNENRAKLNKDIFLFRGNRNIHYYFSIKGARFAFEKEGDLIENANAIYAAVTVIKPNGVEVANAIAPVENGLIHLKVTEDLIDEEVEIGDFDLVFDLFDDSDGAVTIPKIKGQFHVQERPCTTSIGTLSGNVNVVNQAVVDLAIATQENEQLIVVDDDGKYVKTTWVKGDKISIERLNKIEEGIEKNSTQYKDIADKVNAIKSSSLINQNGGGLLKIWAGTKVEYDALLVKDENTVYLVEGSGGGSTTVTTYTITNNLSSCTNSNSSTSVNENDSYSATITPNENYVLSTVTVTMGGNDITNTVYTNGNILIKNVTGNIVITVNAIQQSSTTYNITNTLSNCINSNSKVSINKNSSYSAMITANFGYKLDDVTVTMGGVDITSTAYSNGQISISSVIGDIVIIANASQKTISTNISYQVGYSCNTSGNIVKDDKKAITDYVPVTPGSSLKTSSDLYHVIRSFDSSGTFLGTVGGNLEKEKSVTLNSNVAYILFLLTPNANATVDVNDSDINGKTITINNTIYTLTNE